MRYKKLVSKPCNGDAVSKFRFLKHIYYLTYLLITVYL